MSTFTVLLVPNIPPGSTMLPTKKVSVCWLPAVVSNVCATPVAELLVPVRSSHCAPQCAGKEKPPWVNVPLTIATLPVAPVTFQCGNVVPVLNRSKLPPPTIGCSNEPLPSTFVVGINLNWFPAGGGTTDVPDSGPLP